MEIVCQCNLLFRSYIVMKTYCVKEISASLLYTYFAVEIWQDLKDRFEQGNAPRLFELRRELMNIINQGALNVSSYFTKLKTVWQELMEYRPKRVCSCGGLQKMDAFYQSEYLQSFLMGLNDSYSQIISQILLMDPLPTINKAFSLVVQEERKRRLKIPEATSSDNSLAFAAYRSNPRVFTSSNKNVRKDRPICTHCNIPGHTVEKCYKIHGYPPGYKFKPRNANSPNAVATPSLNSKMSTIDLASDSHPSISPEQYKQLMSLLSSHVGNSTTNSAVPTNTHITGFWDKGGAMASPIIFKGGFREHSCTSRLGIPNSISCGGLMLFHCILISLLLLTWSYFMVLLKDPGSVPENWILVNESESMEAGSSSLPELVPSEAAANYSSVDSVERRPTAYCHRCRNGKPPRCHHCSVCQRCVLKMDHHCIWVVNCVGACNYKFFLLFLLYTFLETTMDTLVLLPNFIKFFDEAKSHTSSPSNLTIIFLAFVLNLALALSLLCFVVMHASLLLSNTTSIEVHEKKRAVQWKYDLGRKKNFEQAALWLLPLFSKEDLENIPALRGLEFPTRSHAEA